MTPPGTPSDSTEASLGRWLGVGQASSTTAAPGSLNEVTTFSTSAVGQVASRSIGVGPAGQTVAGVGVAAEPRDRARVVPVVGLAGLTRVVVGAVGQGRRSPPRRPRGRVGSGGGGVRSRVAVSSGWAAAGVVGLGHGCPFTKVGCARRCEALMTPLNSEIKVPRGHATADFSCRLSGHSESGKGSRSRHG